MCPLFAVADIVCGRNRKSRSVKAALKFADYQFAILVDDPHDTLSPGLNQNGMLIHINFDIRA